MMFNKAKKVCFVRWEGTMLCFQEKKKKKEKLAIFRQDS